MFAVGRPTSSVVGDDSGQIPQVQTPTPYVSHSNRTATMIFGFARILFFCELVLTWCMISMLSAAVKHVGDDAGHDLEVRMVVQVPLRRHKQGSYWT